MAAGKVRVRAVQNVLGLRAGVVTEVEDSEALQTAIAAGKVEKVSAAEAKRSAEQDGAASAGRAAHGAGDTK